MQLERKNEKKFKKKLDTLLIPMSAIGELTKKDLY